MFSAAFVWGRILSFLEQRMSPHVVETWFSDAEILEYTDDRLVIYVPDELRKGFILNHCASTVKAAMKEIFGLNATVQVLCGNQLESFHSSSQKGDFLAFNPNFTFEKFVVGASNRLAHAAALAMAEHEKPPVGYNPLFIYGPPGLGKTHLLYAIASRIHKLNPNHSIVYAKGDQFTNELIQAIREGKMVSFRDKYRNADVFLVDDIQFIAGKDSTEEEYFHTFNALYENDKKIIIAADRPPSSMQKLTDRLRTRFECALQVEISPPDYETRMAILRNNSLRNGIELPADVCSFIAENVTSDVRRLEGAVKKLKATSDLEGLEIDMNVAMRVLKNLSPDNKSLPTPYLILSEVSRFYSLENTALTSNQRSKVISEARQVAMYLLKTMLDMSTTDIGRELKRDHTTVIYGVERITEKLKAPHSGIGDNIRDITANINNKL